jgi:hypothetical protein
MVRLASSLRRAQRCLAQHLLPQSLKLLLLRQLLVVGALRLARREHACLTLLLARDARRTGRRMLRILRVRLQMLLLLQVGRR